MQGYCCWSGFLRHCWRWSHYWWVFNSSERENEWSSHPSSILQLNNSLWSLLTPYQSPWLLVLILRISSIHTHLHNSTLYCNSLCNTLHTTVGWRARAAVLLLHCRQPANSVAGQQGTDQSEGFWRFSLVMSDQSSWTQNKVSLKCKNTASLKKWRILDEWMSS